MISKKHSIVFITTVGVAVALIDKYLSQDVPETLIKIRVQNFENQGVLTKHGTVKYSAVPYIIFSSQTYVSAAVPEITMEDVELIQAAAPLIGQFNALVQVLEDKRK